MPPYPSAPPKYVGEDGIAHYWIRMFRHNRTGGYEMCGTICYHSSPPMLSDYPHCDRKLEQTWIFDEANKCWADIPLGHSIPAYSEFQYDDQDDSLVHIPPACHDSPEEDPTPGDVDESTPSGSDFSNDRALVVKKRKREREMGREDSDTELDDLEDDEGLRHEAVPESPVDGRRSRRNGANSKKSKGKRPQRYTDDEGTEESGQEGEGGIAEPGRNSKGSMKKRSQRRADVEDGGEDRERVQAKSKPYFKRGRLSKSEDAVCEDLGLEVTRLVNEAAQSINKNPSEVVLRAGYGIKPSKKNNAWAKYETWYAETHPKPENSTSFMCLSLSQV